MIHKDQPVVGGSGTAISKIEASIYRFRFEAALAQRTARVRGAVQSSFPTPCSGHCLMRAGEGATHAPHLDKRKRNAVPMTASETMQCQR
jgi:hypothetical protein